MLKQAKKSPALKQPSPGKVASRNLMGMKDGGACCAPTPASPVNLHKKLAGAC